MTWRAMSSLLVLRDQANAIAVGRSTASDGLVGDTAHQAEESDHNPHNVPGVGPEMVTALDLTHDPAHGFDSYLFAEVLRTHRDRRIKYVISNHRIFSSYATSTRAAWTWGTYTGTDPHTNHVHVSVLDAAVSDTSTPWDLEGFDMTPSQEYIQHVINYRLAGFLSGQDPIVVPPFKASDGITRNTPATPNYVAQALKALATATPGVDLEALKAAASAGAHDGVVGSIPAIAEAVVDEEAQRIAS
jgi:hypothetical protein